MTYLSSQRYMNEAVVESKKSELYGCESISIPCSYVGFIDGEEYAIVVDKHHTLAAARELGIKVQFVVDPDSENLEGEELLSARWIDSPYYDIETGRDEF